MQRIYLDNNATSPVLPEIVAAMLPYFGESFGNPSSAHALGEDAAAALRAARVSVAALVGARSPREIVFTSGGTESIHRALHAALARSPGLRRIVTTTVEHSAVLEPLETLEKQGFSVIRVGVDGDGTLDRAALDAALTDECALVTVMAANNETGVASDLTGVGALCRARDIAFHVDAVQAAGKMPLDVKLLGADLVSISAHKIHGPKGAGALFVRDGFALAPMFPGGPQESRRRPGTENVPALVGFGRAADLARRFVADEHGPRELARLRDRLESEIVARLAGARVHASRAPRIPNTTNIAFEGVEAEALLGALSAQGVFVSAGSACHAAARRPSHVLLAMGCSASEAAASLRFSLSRLSTDGEVSGAVEAVTEAVMGLRSLA